MNTIRELTPAERALIDKWLQRRQHAEEVLSDLAAAFAGGKDPNVRLVIDGDSYRLVRAQPEEERIKDDVSLMVAGE